MIMRNGYEAARPPEESSRLAHKTPTRLTRTARETLSVPHVGMPAKQGRQPALIRTPLRTSGSALGTVAR